MPSGLLSALESYGNQRFRVVRKAMDLESVKGKLASLVPDKPLGTTADITEHTVVCWNGEQLLGIHLCADHPGVDDMFDIDHELLRRRARAIGGVVCSPAVFAAPRPK
jgi:hypothetical protein